jgi:hypothetical protein
LRSTARHAWPATINGSLAVVLPHIVYVALVIMFLLWNCSSNSTSPDEAEIDGDYLFVEMFIVSYAKQISGNCESGPLRFPDPILYEYVSDAQILIHITGEAFPINEQLEMIFAQQRIWPFSLLGSALFINLVPIYYIPDLITGHAQVDGVNESEVELTVNLKYFKQTIVVPVDSTFTKVTKTIEEGPGENCMREYTDSLIVRNYGFIPKKNFVREF